MRNGTSCQDMRLARRTSQVRRISSRSHHGVPCRRHANQTSTASCTDAPNQRRRPACDSHRCSRVRSIYRGKYAVRTCAGAVLYIETTGRISRCTVSASVASRLSGARWSDDPGMHVSRDADTQADLDSRTVERIGAIPELPNGNYTSGSRENGWACRSTMNNRFQTMRLLRGFVTTSIFRRGANKQVPSN